MKKLLLGMLVCSMASVAMAAPAFDLGAGPLEIQEGTPAVVELTAVLPAGSLNATGMNLYVYVSGPFLLDSIAVDNIGGAWNTTPAPATSGGTWIELDSPNSGYAYANPPASGGANPSIVNGSLLAKITVSVIPGTALGEVGAIMTGSPDYAESDWGADGLPDAQATLALKVVPEPMSALLLLAGLPLLRRRHA